MTDNPTYKQLENSLEKTIELASDYREERDKAINLLEELEPFVQEYLDNYPDKRELLEQLKNMKS